MILSSNFSLPEALARLMELDARYCDLKSA